MITIKDNLFLLQTMRMSYAFAVGRNNKLIHLYWGERLDGVHELARLKTQMDCASPANSLFYLEYRGQEPYDFMEPALLPVYDDGARGARLVYQSHVVENESLRVTLKDEHYPLEVTLVYELFGDLDIVSRKAVIRNCGETDIRLDSIKSATLNLPPIAGNYRVTHYSGDWGAEFGVNQCELTQMQLVLENHRGTCAAHQHVPFVAIDAESAAMETAGDVYFAALKWSGNFKISIEKGYSGNVSITAGINDFDTEWTLRPDESFETPALCCGFSAGGFERMTEILYDWQLDWLAPRPKAHAIRPIIYNSWYPYLFDINEQNLTALVGKAADVGTELFVIDDGWMPKRVNDKAGLGDWIADKSRFPNGLRPISDACHANGMTFGLWVEPEMANPDSDLYRTHPEWFLSDPKRPNFLKRSQLTLDFSQDAVCDWAIGWLDKLITDLQLDYLKWDMNRYLSEYGTDRSMPIRYIYNLYKVWQSLNERHPNVLFENCASGGGRADFGMVEYADRINRSDNAHPADVMILHEGFSRLFVPKTAGGAGNIARDPDVPLPFRIHLGMTGSMSIGIDLLKAPQETLDELRKATAYFKTVRADLQDAYVYRIASARRHPYCIWQYVRRDRKSFGLFGFAHGMREWDHAQLPRFKMRGLLPDAIYTAEDGTACSGRELMAIGLKIPFKRQDYASFFSFFK